MVVLLNASHRCINMRLLCNLVLSMLAGLEKGRKLHGFANTPTGYQSQIKYKGEVLHISTCNTAAAAAKAFDR